MKCSKNNSFTKEVSHQLIAFINENREERLQIDDLAAISGFSKFYLQSFFKAHMGISLGRFVKETYLNYAAFELIHTQNSILSIALNAGYSSQQSFCRAFRQKFNTTPNALRKAGKEHNQVTNHTRMM